MTDLKQERIQLFNDTYTRKDSTVLHEVFLQVIKALNPKELRKDLQSRGLAFTLNLVETLQSHLILTMSHRSSGLPVCFPS
jgi:hypothetical protein